MSACSGARCPRCNGTIIGDRGVAASGSGLYVSIRACLACGYDPDSPRRAPTADESARAQHGDRGHTLSIGHRRTRGPNVAKSAQTVGA